MSLIVINARFLTQPITGVQRFAIEICKRLNFKDLNIQFVAPKNIIHKDLANQLNVLTDLPFSSLKGHLWEQLSLPLYLCKLKQKYLLVNLGNTGPVSVKNQLYTLHDIGFKINPKWYKESFSSFYNLIAPILLRKSRHIITVSQTSKEYIVEYYNIKPTKISVVYNGFYLPGQVLLKNQDQLKHEYILSVSSFNPRKNLDSLIEAFLNLNLPDVHLYLVGNFSDNFSHVSMVNDNRVHFLENIDDEKLVDLYKNASLFVYPSHYEGFGIPILEAMHYNLKICASDISCFKELFCDSIFYFNQNSVDDISKVIQAALNSSDKNCYEDIINKYSWEKSSKQLELMLVKFSK
jgi:glycosyltransferase involved in cell wall biosynthesis